MLSALYYIFPLLQVTVLFVVSILVLIITYPFDKSRRWVHECSRLICALLYGVPFLMRRTIDGVENIDKTKSYVMVMNHNSGFDIFAAYKIPLNFRWVSKREVFRVPFMGPLLTIHGDIPIERGNAAEAMAKVLRLGKLWLSRGASVAIFPEGTRSKTGEINRFKAGAFSLAKEAGVEILPVVLHGTRDVLKKNYMVNWRNHLTVSVLPPISAEAVQSMGTTELIEHTRTMMCEEYEKIRK